MFEFQEISICICVSVGLETDFYTISSASFKMSVASYPSGVTTFYSAAPFYCTPPGYVLCMTVVDGKVFQTSFVLY